MIEQSTNGTNGRNSNGQFAKGNPGGPGNPYARHVARLRASLIEAVGDDGLKDIVQGMVTAAKGGEPRVGVSELKTFYPCDEMTKVITRMVPSF